MAVDAPWPAGGTVSSQHVPRFQDYVLSRVLGEGGMGVVYQATHRLTGLPVAIKVMSRYFEDEEMKARFFRENQILSSLNHRNIVRCYSLIRSLEGMPCLVMEYLDGVDLRSFQGKPYPELLPLMIQVLLGMEYLRQQQIVHRDLSSNNITVVLESGTRLAKILDFGIAKCLDNRPGTGESLTQTGTFMGKYPFAAPELFRTTDADWRCDMYSLGVVFYRLLLRRYPVNVELRNNYYQWVLAHDQFHQISFDTAPGALPLPPELQQLLLAMLAKDPGQRPASYLEAVVVLDQVQQKARSSGLALDPASLAFLPPPVAVGAGSRPSGEPAPAQVPAPPRGDPAITAPVLSGPPLPVPGPVQQARRVASPELEEARTNLIEEKAGSLQHQGETPRAQTPTPSPLHDARLLEQTRAEDSPLSVKPRERTPEPQSPVRRKAAQRTPIDTGVKYGLSRTSVGARDGEARHPAGPQVPLPPPPPRWPLVVALLLLTLFLFAALSLLFYFLLIKPGTASMIPAHGEPSGTLSSLSLDEPRWNGAQTE